MQISLGVDTLSYHCRLVGQEITLEAVLGEVAQLGAEFVQVNAVHVRDYSDDRLSELRGLSTELGLGLTVAGMSSDVRVPVTLRNGARTGCVHGLSWRRRWTVRTYACRRASTEVSCWATRTRFTGSRNS